ncbi:DUF2480 family protein [Parvicella tangerina]|uniref:DUF2480 family protein n=1 Tax=Parvicella tangerina TaxID=2829795 RepID=A0A916JQ61_9FLAO|nr:DUF2480 family protein [Parvicella tangerina]CAG5086480.1 hypothetical protein CRYO30217_03136 [Parvicella tangerina]
MIENKIAKSGLETIDVGVFYDSTQKNSIDIKNWLFQEMIIKEKDFKQHLEEHDWSQYENTYVCYYSSVDAIIPNWAWLMIANKLQGNCKRYYNGTPEQFNEILFSEHIQAFDTSPFDSKRVLIKGCGDKEIPSSAFSMLAERLFPTVKSLMFGEACSNVPIYKQKKS